MAVGLNDKMSLKTIDKMQLKLAPIGLSSAGGAYSDKPPC
ncbi:MAG: hypothetical protein A4E70_02441 [Syntrophus sp. PtaU1.Bin005]|jgi:hypothetical protein|nr:MAG: hypothetical protein A4E69_01264 [Syntrophus sp. PtaB.Bin138]OPY78169.1 MAG: hypothetical protein A4E70_02441 [Syntrophus sp. PtaU1.Bin005]